MSIRNCISCGRDTENESGFCCECEYTRNERFIEQEEDWYDLDDYDFEDIEDDPEYEEDEYEEDEYEDY